MTTFALTVSQLSQKHSGMTSLAINAAQDPAAAHQNSAFSTKSLLAWQGRTREHSAAHLMDEHGGLLRGGHDSVAGTRVAAESEAPAVARGQRQAERVRAVHHREALQPLQSQLRLDRLHCRTRASLLQLQDTQVQAFQLLRTS